MDCTEWYSQIQLRILLNSDLLLNSMLKYHWENPCNKILSLNDPKIMIITLKYYLLVTKICSNTVGIPLKPDVIIGSIVLNGILKYHWQCHWSLVYCWIVCLITIIIIESTIETRLYYWMVKWYCMILWNPIENNTETWFIEMYDQIPLRVTDKHVFHWVIQWYSTV